MRIRTFAWCLLLGGCTFHVEMARSGEGVDVAESAIAAAWREHIDAARRDDLAGALAIYADDAVYAVAGQPELRGKAAIEAMEAAALRTSDVGVVEHLSLALRADGAVAHELGTVAGDVTPVGGAPRRVEFHFLAAWRRDAQGVWRITYLVGHVAATPPAP